MRVYQYKLDFTYNNAIPKNLPKIEGLLKDEYNFYISVNSNGLDLFIRNKALSEKSVSGLQKLVRNLSIGQIHTINDKEKIKKYNDLFKSYAENLK